MHSEKILEKYQYSSYIKTLREQLKGEKKLILKGLFGSLDAVVCSVLLNQLRGRHLFVLHDREEAERFQNDLSNFLEIDSLLFPCSYKKVYNYEEIDNMNVLQRSEVLSKINEKESLAIITYPEALVEKVVNKKVLKQNTQRIQRGDKLDIEFLTELLISYEFKKEDFVYEPGTFSIRGGVLDVFSFADNKPYRLELFGDEVEVIKIFDVETQLSIENVDSFNIVPNNLETIVLEEKQPFFEYLDDHIFWVKDLEYTKEKFQKNYDKIITHYEDERNRSGSLELITPPNELYVDLNYLNKHLLNTMLVEFGNRFHMESSQIIVFESQPQPSFSKNIELLIEDLKKYVSKDYVIYLVSDSTQQIKRISSIFDELEVSIPVEFIKASLGGGFIDDELRIVCYTDHQIFERYQKTHQQGKYRRSEALTISDLNVLQPGDFVVHMDYGIGKFVGLETIEISGNQQEAICLVFQGDDLLYVSIHSLHKISKYSGKEGHPPVISKLGSQEWEAKKRKVKKKVRDIAKDLIQLYAKRKNTQGFAFPKDDYLQIALEASFMYQDTPDQSLTTQDVKKDMEQPHPMDRLVCGDVGFGKTEVAIRAAFKAVSAGKQVVVLVPTTILALQHYNTFSERLKRFGINIDYLNRFRTTKEATLIKKKLKEGKIEILIGTHGISNKKVVFKDLGLVIIDEEQKFGVKVKEQLKHMKINVDSLTLTATPIPRTLHFSLMRARDFSVISTPPPNRRSVTTELHAFKKEVIRDAIKRELDRQGQVFFVHSKIRDIDSMANIILELIPDAKIAIAHGMMEGSYLEKQLLDFVEKRKNILISTNIIESGLDIPNANTIIINNAHMFGISDLHQMRGRVGRSNRKAYCYLLTPSVAQLTADARKRLITIEEFSNLGDGFKIAMRDLDIRGAGNLLGSEQSGFINDIGFDMYHKILDEAVEELKEKEFKHIFETEKLADIAIEEIKKEDCIVETDFEALISEGYVKNISERLNLYTQLDNLKNEKQIKEFTAMLKDRFGKLPEEIYNLLDIVRLRWKSIDMGFEKVIIKNNKLKGYISGKKSEQYFQSKTFESIIDYVRENQKTTRLKDVRSKLIINIEEIDSICSANRILDKIARQNGAISHGNLEI